MKVAAIIVGYNAMSWIDKCITSLKDSSQETKVFWVDNGSSDGTPEKIKQEFEHVELVESKENLGFGRANNLGIEMAYKQGFEYFFLLNQDAWVKHDTIAQLIKVLEANEDFGVVSPIHLNGTGNKLDFGFFKYSTHKQLRFEERELYSDMFSKNFKEVYRFKFINAAAWMIKRSCIEKIGGFDPLFSHYVEDNHYCLRLLYHNVKLGVAPEAIAYHDREDRLKKPLDSYVAAERSMLKALLDPNWNVDDITRIKSWKIRLRRDYWSHTLFPDKAKKT